MLSDEVLGHHLQLIGIGVDPLAHLSRDQQDAWQKMGGKTTILTGSESVAKAGWVDLDKTFGVERFPQGWIVAVRPDKVIIADGVPKRASAIVQTVAHLLQ